MNENENEDKDFLVFMIFAKNQLKLDKIFQIFRIYFVNFEQVNTVNSSVLHFNWFTMFWNNV